LVRAYQAQPDSNKGHRFETLIYLHERRRTRYISYYRNGFELDMCWGDGARFRNVAWDISDPDTLAREIKAFDAGLSLWPQAEARLVYGIGDPLPPALRHRAIPGWEYLLQHQ